MQLHAVSLDTADTEKLAAGNWFEQQRGEFAAASKALLLLVKTLCF
jgi:hypothetical protein